MNFIVKKISNKRWLLCCLLFFVMACHSKNHYNNFTFSKTDSITEEQNVTNAFDSYLSI